MSPLIFFHLGSTQQQWSSLSKLNQILSLIFLKKDCDPSSLKVTWNLLKLHTIKVNIVPDFPWNISDYAYFPCTVIISVHTICPLDHFPFIFLFFKNFPLEYCSYHSYPIEQCNMVPHGVLWWLFPLPGNLFTQIIK